MKELSIWTHLGELPESYVLDALPPSWRSSGAPAPEKKPSGFSRFMSSGWVAACLSAVVAVGVIVAIVLAGRGGDEKPPVLGTVESVESEESAREESEELLLPDSGSEGSSESETAPETEPETVPELTDLSAITVTAVGKSAVLIPGDLNSGTYYDESGLPVEMTPSDRTRDDRILSGDLPTVVMPQGTDLEWFYFRDEDWIYSVGTAVYLYDSTTDERPVRFRKEIPELVQGTYFVCFSMRARGPAGKNNRRDTYEYDYTFRLVVDDSAVETVPETTPDGAPATETEPFYDAPRPDPERQLLNSTCNIVINFSDASVQLSRAYIYDGKLTVSSGPSGVTSTDHVCAATGAPIDGSYLRALSEDPFLPTVCTKDPASFKHVITAGSWRPTSNSYVVYNAHFQRIGAQVRELPEGVYYVVMYSQTNGGTHRIGGWTLKASGVVRYNIPFRLVVGDVDFTPPTYPAEEKLHAPFDGLSVTTDRGSTVIDQGYLYEAALTDANGQTALYVDHPAISYVLARNLGYNDKTVTVYADSAASINLSPVKKDAESTVVKTKIFDAAYALTDTAIHELPNGTYYILADIELTGGRHTVDGNTYAGGTARYQVLFELHIG